MPSISVLVVDRQRTFGDALATRLRLEDDLVAEAAVYPATPALGLLAGRPADVMLLDGDVPGNAAFGLCGQIASREDAPRVVILSASAPAERIVAAVRAGAVAWVRKDAGIKHLLRVIRGVARGETWLPQAELGRVLHLLIDERDERNDCERLLAALTPREREVLSHMAEGAGRCEIADRLHLSANTVRTHIQSLMAKLDVHSSLEAAMVSRTGLDGAIDWSSSRW